VGVYLKDTTSNWRLTLILEKRKPPTWEHFKRVFYAQFLPPDFEDNIKEEWDWLSQKENERVTAYVDKYWATLLKVTPFMRIREEEEKQKFESGLLPHLHKSMKVYPRDTLPRMMESAIIAESLHTLGTPRKQEINTYRTKQE